MVTITLAPLAGLPHSAAPLAGLAAAYLLGRIHGRRALMARVRLLVLIVHAPARAGWQAATLGQGASATWRDGHGHQVTVSAALAGLPVVELGGTRGGRRARKVTARRAVAVLADPAAALNHAGGER